VIPRTPTARGGDPLPHLPPARPLARQGVQAPRCWDPNLGPPQLFSRGCAPGLMCLFTPRHLLMLIVPIHRRMARLSLPRQLVTHWVTVFNWSVNAVGWARQLSEGQEHATVSARPTGAEMAGEFVAAFDGYWWAVYSAAEETSASNEQRMYKHRWNGMKS